MREPINPNTEWDNEHTLYLGASGSGKSQACIQNKAIPKNARVVLWDSSGDHIGVHYRSRLGFLKALDKALRQKKGFRIAFGGNRTVENYEWWCGVVWQMLNGDLRTYAIVEELSAVCVSAAKATKNAAMLLNEGRKYGLVFHGTSQKPQEISKTYFDQCERKLVGRQKGLAMRKKMALEIGVEPNDIGALAPLEFFYDDGTADDPELIKLKYKKVDKKKEVIWAD